MLVGLGKRTDRPGQSADTEQFWVYAENPLLTNQWCDAVFPIKGNGGIEIHSLVFVPDCNSPHALQADLRLISTISKLAVKTNLASMRHLQSLLLPKPVL